MIGGARGGQPLVDDGARFRVRALLVRGDAVDDGRRLERDSGLTPRQVLAGLNPGVVRHAAGVRGAVYEPAGFNRGRLGPILGIGFIRFGALHVVSIMRVATQRGGLAHGIRHLGVGHRVVRGVPGDPERGEAAAPPHRGSLSVGAEAK